MLAFLGDNIVLLPSSLVKFFSLAIFLVIDILRIVGFVFFRSIAGFHQIVQDRLLVEQTFFIGMNSFVTVRLGCIVFSPLLFLSSGGRGPGCRGRNVPGAAGGIPHRAGRRAQLPAADRAGGRWRCVLLVQKVVKC